MAAPVPLAESYVNCIDSTFVLGTTPDTWSATVTEGGLTHTVEVDEMTNNTSLGHYEDVSTVDKYEGDITIAFSVASPPPILAGQIYHCVITKPGGGPIFTGAFRFVSIGYPVLTVKSGLKLPVKITSQGTIVKT